MSCRWYRTWECRLLSHPLPHLHQWRGQDPILRKKTPPGALRIRADESVGGQCRGPLKSNREVVDDPLEDLGWAPVRPVVSIIFDVRKVGRDPTRELGRCGRPRDRVGEVTNQCEVLAQLDLTVLLALPQAVEPAPEVRSPGAVVTHTTRVLVVPTPRARAVAGVSATESDRRHLGMVPKFPNDGHLGCAGSRLGR